MNGQLIERLAWVLIHFLWEGALLAAILFAALHLTKRRSPNTRYGLACVALVACMLCPVVTYVARLPKDAGTLLAPEVHSNRLQGSHVTPAIPFAVGTLPASQSLPWLQCIFALWFVGVAALTVRLIGGLIQVERLKRVHSVPRSAEWQERFDGLAALLRIRRPVLLLESVKISAPIAMGVFRAVVILPCSVTLKLSPREVEALLLHELAHLRRHDYLVNLVQTVIETLLFYHPAVWWISKVIRAEREHCCDDIASRAFESPIAYARALASLEEVRVTAPSLSMSANGGSLMRRIQRILGQSEFAVRNPRPLPSLALLLCLITALGFTMHAIGQANPSVKAKTSKVHPSNKLAAKRTVKRIAQSKASSSTAAKPTRTLGPIDQLYTIQRDPHSHNLEIVHLPSAQAVQKALAAGQKVFRLPASRPPKGFEQADMMAISGPSKVAPPATTNAAVAKSSKAPLLPKHYSNDVNLDFVDKPFAAAIGSIADQTGISIVIAQAAFPTVTVKLRHVDPVEALTATCYAAGAKWSLHGDVYYVSVNSDQSDPIGDSVSLHMHRATIGAVVTKLGALYGVKIIGPDASTGFVTFDIDKSNIETALFRLCEQTRLQWHFDNGVYTLYSK